MWKTVAECVSVSVGESYEFMEDLGLPAEAETRPATVFGFISFFYFGLFGLQTMGPVPTFFAVFVLD